MTSFTKMSRCACKEEIADNAERCPRCGNTDPFGRNALAFQQELVKQRIWHRSFALTCVLAGLFFVFQNWESIFNKLAQ